MKRKLFQLLGVTGVVSSLIWGAYSSKSNGAASTIPAYYDHRLFNIHFVEFSSTAEQQLLQHNGSLNFIYQYDPGLPNGQPFISVIDAIPGDGFNPIWEEVQLNFTGTNAPVQFFSDDQVLNAVTNGIVTLDFTGEVYWCPVVGQKPKQ